MSRGTLLCLPGTLLSPRVFDLVARDSPFDLTSYAWMDTPGPWDVLTLARRIADHASHLEEPVFLAGHSTGGAIALTAAIQSPDTFDGLIISGSGADMEGHGDVDAIIQAVKTNWGEALCHRVLRRSFRTQLPHDWDKHFKDYATSARQDVVLEVLQSQRDLNLAPSLPSLESPVVVAHGRDDNARPIAHAEKLVGLIPTAELILLDAGHSPMFEDPTGYVTALNALQRLWVEAGKSA